MSLPRPPPLTPTLHQRYEPPALVPTLSGCPLGGVGASSPGAASLSPSLRPRDASKRCLPPNVRILLAPPGTASIAYWFADPKALIMQQVLRERLAWGTLRLWFIVLRSLRSI